jgi:alkyldihydroxyacetonephosphate synthase
LAGAEAQVAKRLKFWGWGYEGDGLDLEGTSALLRVFAEDFGILPNGEIPVPRLEDIRLARPRIAPPGSLSGICTSDPYERILHAFGQSQPDSIRIFDRDFAHAPDIVAYPTTEKEVSALFDWAGSTDTALIPYGGGSSVVGGVTPDVDEDFVATLTVDLSKLNKVVEVDPVSRAALIQGGARGPDLEAQLKPHGLTLRHFPQSFEHSTLGGWIATRSGGHFATLYTHIDDLVENITMVTPAGRIATRRLPGSGAGPSPDRFIMGSEGAFGIITEAGVRVQNRPTFKATAGYRFADFFDAARAVCAVAQAGLYPANLRIVDGTELQINGAADGSFTLMVVSFESADHPVDPWMARAEECCLDLGGAVDVPWQDNPDAHLQGAVGAWRTAFIRMPYNREQLTPRGIISDTFETATTWDHFEGFYNSVKEATETAIKEVTGKDGAVSCRFSHAYPDGPAPYFAFHGEGKPGSLREQWQEIKNAASDAIIANGGTITHHHAVGRDHQKWYELQRPALFGDMLADAKRRLDPRGILNPGVVVG